jgi:DNA-binding NarL/FixJ family response regulator
VAIAMSLEGKELGGQMIPTEGQNGVPVVIANSNLNARKGLTSRFSPSQGFLLVRCGSALDEALLHCRKLVPCVLIVGQEIIDGLDPIEFSSSVGFGRSIRVLVLLKNESPSLTEAVLRMGCMGSIPADVSLVQLRRAVRAVARGEAWASRTVLTGLLQRFLFHSADSSRRLTPRELEILNLIAAGLKNQQIADQLCISRETVRWHLRSLYSKLGVQDRLSAAFHAWGQGDGTLRANCSQQPPSRLTSLPVSAEIHGHKDSRVTAPFRECG